MKNYLIISLLFLSVGFSQQIIHTETYESGNIKSITYHKKTRDGIEIVKYEGYYKDGQKEEKRTYKGLDEWGTPKEDGLSTEWYKNGQKWREETYKDGKLDGLWTNWHNNGQKKREATYKDGKEDGLWTTWYKNGQKSDEGTYKDGELIDKICWDEDGDVCECHEDWWVGCK